MLVLDERLFGRQPGLEIHHGPRARRGVQGAAQRLQPLESTVRGLAHGLADRQIPGRSGSGPLQAVAIVGVSRGQFARGRGEQARLAPDRAGPFGQGAKGRQIAFGGGAQGPAVGQGIANLGQAERLSQSVDVGDVVEALEERPLLLDLRLQGLKLLQAGAGVLDHLPESSRVVDELLGLGGGAGEQQSAGQGGRRQRAKSHDVLLWAWKGARQSA